MKGKKRFGRWSIWLLCAVVVGLGVFGVYTYAHRARVYAMEAVVGVDVLYDGITVGGIDVGGLTREQARQAVMASLRDRLDRPGITITYEGRRWELSRYDLLDTGTVDAALDAA